MNREIIKLLETGTLKQIKTLFSFDSRTDKDLIRKKFLHWSRYFFPQLFKSPDADFHKQIDEGNIGVYLNGGYFLDIGFRGNAKTTRTKLFIAFAIANDLDHFRKYFKVLSKDLSNARQSTTDV